MSCFFCNAEDHLSQNCDQYISDESRRKIVHSKHCCRLCLYRGVTEKWCKRCKFYKKCYICFTKAHHTVYCPERTTVASNAALTLPERIDKLLLKRYMECLTLEEQYSLAFSVPEAFAILKPKKLQKHNFNLALNLDELQRNANAPNIFVYNVTLKNTTVISRNLRFMIFKAAKIDIENSTLTAEDFMQLLWINTKEIKCSYANFSTELKLFDILKKVPKIKRLDFWKSNLTVAKTWANDLMVFKRGKDFEFLKITLNDFDFDVQALVNFIKTRSIRTSQFNVTISSSNYHSIYYTLKEDELSEELDDYFYKVQKENADEPVLKVTTVRRTTTYHCLCLSQPVTVVEPVEG